MPGNALIDVTNKPAQFQQARRYTQKEAPVQTEREKLLLALLYPKPGTELGLLIKFYSPDSIEEKWNAYVRASLDLEFIGMAKAHSFGSVATGLALKGEWLPRSKRKLIHFPSLRQQRRYLSRAP